MEDNCGSWLAKLLRKNVEKMKTRNFVIVVLCVFTIFCDAKSISNSNINMADNRDHHLQSKFLIDRYNKKRQEKKMNNIVQDTTLDNICRTLITNRTYRNTDNTFKEDSIRNLIFEGGLIDYQYEIKEVSDKDTTATFNSFLLADNSSKTRMGYIRAANKHILLKTNRFLQYDHCTYSMQTEKMDMFKKVSNSIITISDVTFYLKTPVPGKYFYQLYNHIPLSTEKVDNIKKYEVQTSKTCDDHAMYDIMVQSTDSNTVFIILDTNNERIAVIKF